MQWRDDLVGALRLRQSRLVRENALYHRRVQLHLAVDRDFDPGQLMVVLVIVTRLRLRLRLRVRLPRCSDGFSRDFGGARDLLDFGVVLRVLAEPRALGGERQQCHHGLTFVREEVLKVKNNKKLFILFVW